MEPIKGVAGSSHRKNIDARKRVSTMPVLVSDPATNIGFRRHVRFWDRTNKGYITPMDTAAGLSHLGYNVIVSLTFGALLTAILSYATQDSWLPDPRCRIHVQKWMRSKRRHRHHYPLFDEYGRFDTNRFDALFDKYAQSDLSRNVIKFSEVLQMANDYHQCGTSPTAWVCIAVQWAGIYLLIGKDGILRKKDVRAVFDGSLFFRICDSSRSSFKGNAAVAYQQQQSLFPRGIVRVIEKKLNAALGRLPRSASHAIERRIHSWLSAGRHDDRFGLHLGSGPSRLAGVPDDDDDDDGHSSSKLFGQSDQWLLMLLQEQNGDAYSLIHERLTGTKLVSLDEQSFALTGIQGYPGPQRVLSDEATESQVSELSPMMLQGRIFGNDDDDDYAYRRDGPFEDSHRSWLVQDPDRGGDNFRKPNDDDEEVPLFTLSGLRRASAPEKALQIVQVPPDRMEEHDPAPDKSPTELPIVRAPATPYSSRMHTISIVEDWSPLKYQQDFATFEPVILSGLQTDKDAFEIAARSSSSLIGIVQTHVAEEQEQAPFALSGLRRSSYITSKSQQSSSADVEPVVLSGLLRQDEYFVRESSAAKDAFEFVGFAGSDEEEQGSSDEEPHTPTNLAPVALTGIRATGSPFAGFVEDPSPSVGHASAVDDDDVVVDLEPVLLSGLRTDRAYAGIVQEPTSPAPQSPALTEHDPSGAAGIRGSHLLYTGFVQTPQDFGHNDHAPALGLERVVLSGIQVDLEEDPREEMSLLGVVAPLQQLQLHGVREGTEVPSPPRAMPIVEEASFEPSPRSIIATAVPEQIRLTGISESESEVPLKNWLNTDALPGTLRAPAASQSGPYAEAGASIPDDYIEERPEEEIVPDTGNGSISVAPDAAMPPPPPPLLKNWLNMDALPGTISDYAVYEKPTPTDDNNNNDDGMDTKAAQLRNWLQTGHLQGVVPAADAAQEEPTQAVYANPNVSMPDDNDNEVMLAESRRPLSGTAVVVTDEDHADAVALRNLLSLAPQPSADEQSPDMVCKDKDEQHPSRADDTWNDANSHSSTPDAGHALSPPSPKDTPLKHEHLHLTWPALAEIVDQKEE